VEIEVDEPDGKGGKRKVKKIIKKRVKKTRVVNKNKG
jgi:hypothetical protein